MARKFQIDVEVLQAALVGLRQQRAEIEGKMAEIRRVLGSRAPLPISASVPTAAPRAKRQLSVAARKSIAKAQKKRWAAFHAAQTEEPPPAKKERKISAAGRKRIARATKKRWAAFRAKQAAAAKAPKKAPAKAAKKPAKPPKQVAAKPAQQATVAQQVQPAVSE